MDPIVARIKEIQQASGMSNGEFAQALDMSAASLSHIYNGRNKPSLSVIESIIKNLNVSADYILLGEKNTTPSPAEPTPPTPTPQPPASEPSKKPKTIKKIQSVITTYDDGTFDVFLPNQ